MTTNNNIDIATGATGTILQGQGAGSSPTFTDTPTFTSVALNGGTALSSYFDLENGEILCMSCHMKEHSKDHKEHLVKYHFKKGQKAPSGAFKKGNIPWNKGGVYRN